MAVRVVTDSTSCMPAEDRERYGIDVVSLSVSFGDDTFPEEGADTEAFYARLKATPKPPTSSQPTPGEFEAVFERHLAAGDDVVGVFISSDMSGTLSSAELAAKQVGPRHPGRTIELVDSRSNSMQLGLAVLQACRAADAGASVSESARAARDTIPRTRFVFAPVSLEYLRRGGRIGGASALLGTLLQVKPILTVAGGRVEVLRRVRTTARALAGLVDQMAADGERFGLAEVVVHHIADETAGRALAATVRERVGVEARVVPIGPVVGLHVGPGTSGIVYRTERPIEPQA